MKKTALSVFIIILFTVYVIHQKSEASQVQVALPSTQDGTKQNVSDNPSTPATTPSNNKDFFKDGQYTGDSVDAFYGNVQVKATISGGKLNDVQFLDYPHDRQTSQRINEQAMPYLKTEAIQAQSASVDIVSGATATSQAFVQALQSALSKAQG
jgi:uncharacterized protein with FMN-binding domain